MADTDSQLPAAMAHLADLIAFDTVSRNSNLPLIDHVEAHLARLGGVATRLPDKTGTKANLVVRFGPEDAPGIVLSGHTDVVPARTGNWTTPPFEAVERDGRIYGRGTCDMKGFLACLMAMAETLDATTLARPLYLCFSHDEEVGCLGAPAIARHLKALPHPPDLAIIGEPSGMALVTGQKGKIAVRATVTGAGGHSSFAPEHVNAVAWAARAIAMIDDRARSYVEDGPFDPDFTVPHATCLATMIEGGVATNVTPDSCDFTFELRSIDEAAARADLEALQTRIRDTLEPAMQAIHPGTGIAFETLFSYPAMGDATGTPGFERLRPLLPPFGGKVSYGSEGGVFEIEGGIPAIIVGPGSIAQAHKADEYVEIDQLALCLAFLERLIAAASNGARA
ncbi:acetylornithine deacetylase [Palleronia sp. LCG004]|uniref:acetylornithine deacetylase n=1 Tax=Palleronia sp. LCG004 TaxID=3079304 RepID=UPI002943AAD7|nr:acetylornithine deacetylase [Palleronia sp. LCG004]WOI58169.1 acetylornithine deacetylase [Palleronia sp. LCG004]